MAFLKRSQILEIDDIKTETVSVPEWGGEVMVRGLSGAERDGFEASLAEVKGKKTEINLQNIRAKLCALTMVDEDGGPVFDQPGDIEALGEKSGAALERVFQVARRLSGLSEADVEELEKNSVSAPSGASTSV